MEKVPSERAAWSVVAALIVGYIGVYLCRQNFSVANPMLQAEFGVSRERVGEIASMATVAYAVGKLVNGAVVDRIGGRAGFLFALLSVALFGGVGAMAPTLGGLALFYSFNRFAGSAGWGSMMKLMPTWFQPARMGTVIGVLSVSYVIGGGLAVQFASWIRDLGGGWRAVMGVPSLVLLVITACCLFIVRRGPLHPEPAAETEASRLPDPPEAGSEPPFRRWESIRALLLRPQFFLVCALSFTLTLVRESFNTWKVDFLTTVLGGSQFVSQAATWSTGFDYAGALSIVLMGVAYDRIWPSARRWLIAGLLGLLSVAIAALPSVGAADPLAGAWLVAAVGLLVYGPYSLLGGVMAVESGGPRLAATAAGIIDSFGYLAGILAGKELGRLLDQGGYSLGFLTLAGFTAVSAVLALGLRLQPLKMDESVAR